MTGSFQGAGVPPSSPSLHPAPLMTQHPGSECVGGQCRVLEHHPRPCPLWGLQEQCFPLQVSLTPPLPLLHLGGSFSLSSLWSPFLIISIRTPRAFASELWLRLWRCRVCAFRLCCCIHGAEGVWLVLRDSPAPSLRPVPGSFSIHIA